MSKMMWMTAAALVGALFAAGAAGPAWAASDGATYSYDALGRLTEVTYANGTTVVYSYDAAGNRSSQVVTCSAGGC